MGSSALRPIRRAGKRTSGPEGRPPGTGNRAPSPSRFVPCEPTREAGKEHPHPRRREGKGLLGGAPPQVKARVALETPSWSKQAGSGFAVEAVHGGGEPLAGPRLRHVRGLADELL